MSKRTQMQEKTEPQEARAVEPVLVGLEVPLMEIPEGGYVTRHVEVQRLSLAQARTLKRIQCACLATGTRLTNGKPVQSGADAVRWLLEQVDVQGEAEAARMPPDS